jgi:hypothetical protein
MKTLLEDIREEFPEVKFEDSLTQLGYIVRNGNKMAYLDTFGYTPIGHTEIVGKEMVVCEECGFEHEQDKKEFIIDVPIDKLSEKQKDKQREPIRSILRQLII